MSIEYRPTTSRSMNGNAVFALVLAGLAAALAPAPAHSQTAPKLVFKSGFEGTNRLVPRRDGSSHYDITGSDGSDYPSDWSKDLTKGTPYFSNQQFYLQSGTEDERKLAIVADPDAGNSKNKVLKYSFAKKHILMPSGEEKARIQHELTNKNAPPPGGYTKQFYLKFRMYLSPSFKVLEDAPTDKIGWIGLHEFWNDPSFDAPNGDGTFRKGVQARTGVMIEKHGGKLRFGAKGRYPVNAVPKSTGPSWSVVNKDFAIPFGKWMTQEIYVKEGKEDGRFYMSVTIDGVKTVIVDKIGMTTAPLADYVPDGQTSFTLTKFYTEGKVIDWFTEKGLTADIYWDDVEIWSDRHPETIVK